MQILALSINYHSAPLAIRERVVFHHEHLPDALAKLLQTPLVREAVILSTCNRTELYCVLDKHQIAENVITDWLATYHDVPRHVILPYLSILPQQQAVQHVFRVTSSLDSMVLGEPQILGQMKAAVRAAQAADALGSFLHKLFQSAFMTAKEIRSVTALGENIISIAAVSVKLAKHIFEHIADQHVLFIGAGEMIRLALAHFNEQRPKKLTIANRTLERGYALAARYGAELITLNELNDRLSDYDIVISCTASPLPIIELGMIEQALRKRRHKPMLIVDLAVPRDIDPAVANLDDAFLYTIDDLSDIVKAGFESRRSAVVEAEAIVNANTEKFIFWLATRKNVPAIRALRETAEQMRQQELNRALQRLTQGEDPKQIIERLSLRLTAKLIHEPTRIVCQQDIQI